jgi:hypothetical protein
MTRHRFNRAWLYVFAALLVSEGSGCSERHTPPTGASPALTIQAVQPGIGLAGTSVAIWGAGFTPETIVTIDGIVTKATFINDVHLTAIVPAHEPGAVNVIVSNPDGTTRTLVRGFSYLAPPVLAVTAVTPAVGSTAGGTSVFLSGTNFKDGFVASIDGVVQQSFFGTSSVVVLSTTPHAAGPVDIRITNPDGETTFVTAKYSFVPPQSLDFNGTWDAYPADSEELLFRFTILNNALVSLTCGSSTPVVFSPQPAVVNGEFSFTGTIGSVSGRILAPRDAIGAINVPGCVAAAWYASK